MWWVLSAHASKLDDIEATLAAYRGCSASPLADMCAPHLPWWDRFAVSISLGHLVQFEPGGTEPGSDVRSPSAVISCGAGPAPAGVKDAVSMTKELA